MDPKEILQRLEKAFADFQVKNDQRLAEIEKGQKDTSTIVAVEKLNTEITSLQGLYTEALQSIERLTVGGVVGDHADAHKRLVKEAQIFFAGRRGVEAAHVGEAEVKAYGLYADMFPNWLRNVGTGINPAEFQAIMQVGSDPDGGYWVPTQRQTLILKRLFDTSPIRQVASVIGITTDSIAWPIDTDDAVTGGFVGETEARAETTTPTVGESTIYVREQYAEPHVTQKLLDMSTIDVEGWLGDKIADKLSRVENNRFVVGTGVKAPRGFLDYSGAAVVTDDATRAWGILQYVPVGAAGAFPTVSGSVAHDPDALITIVSKLKPQYRAGAIWMMPRSAEAEIRKLKDSQGRYFIEMGDPRSGFTGFSIGGFPIVTAEDMPVIASNSFSVAFGNFRTGYQIVDGRGIRILRDNLTTKGRVKFYTTKWTGGDVVNFDAIKLLKFATT